MKPFGTRQAWDRNAAHSGGSLFVYGAALVALALPVETLAAVTCARTLTADVVVFDQPLMYNRLGAQNVNGITYALRRDVVELSCRPDPVTGAIGCTPGSPLTSGGIALPGKVALRPDKRPRPLVLRAAAGDCLQIHFENLLAPAANSTNPPAGFTLPVAEQPGDEPHGRLPRAGHAARRRHRGRRLRGGPERRQPGRAGQLRPLRLLRREGGNVPRHQSRRRIRRRRPGRQQRQRHVRGDQRGAARCEVLPEPGHRGGDAARQYRTDLRRTARPGLRGHLPGDRPERRAHGLGPRGQGRASRPQHAEGLRDRPFRPERRDRRQRARPGSSPPAPIRWRAWAR